MTSISPKAPTTLNAGPNFLTERELAKRWAVSCKLLQKWRQLGEGPRYHKLGSAVRYAQADVLAFEQAAIR